jgi:hypothetical protein
MKRAPSKKGTDKGADRRKRPRSTAKAKASSTVRRSSTASEPQANSRIKTSRNPIETAPHENCQHCAKALVSEDRALFVEEEVGRIFCSEACIAGFFAPEIERLEKDYFRKVSDGDLTKDERESYSHLRWITLQEPDEIWREKTLSGDHRYTLISEFQPGAKRVWSVCICLFLKGEPSFLYLAFTSKNAALINTYREGERVEWAKDRESAEGSEENPGISPSAHSDRLADSWTEDETFLAQVNQERRADDIAPEDFVLYEKCMEETLETPDEVWSCQPGENTARLYHFIRYYKAEDSAEETDSPELPELDDGQASDSGIWYLIIARETEDEEQIEILDAFPTRDAALVDRYRRGEQEVGHTAPGPISRVVH